MLPNDSILARGVRVLRGDPRLRDLPDDRCIVLLAGEIARLVDELFGGEPMATTGGVAVVLSTIDNAVEHLRGGDALRVVLEGCPIDRVAVVAVEPSGRPAPFLVTHLPRRESRRSRRARRARRRS